MAREKILTEESTEKKVNEDLENENVDEVESEEFSDSSDENKDEKESSDDDEKEKTKDFDGKNGKKKQSKEENRKFAERRREREKQEKDRKAIEEKAYRKAILEIVKINPYTEKEIKTDKDVQVYLNMKKLEEAGLDPVSDYWQLDEVIAKEKEKETSPKIDLKEDALQFVKDFPDVSLADLNKDQRFLKFAKGKIGNLPLSEIYGDYQEFIGEFENETEKKARKILARQKSTPGSLSDKSDNKTINYATMSDAEFEKVLEKARTGRLSKL